MEQIVLLAELDLLKCISEKKHEYAKELRTGLRANWNNYGFDPPFKKSLGK